MQTKNKEKYQKVERKIEKMNGENICEYFNIFISEKQKCYNTSKIAPLAQLDRATVF